MVEFGHYLRQQRLTAGVEDMRYAAELVDQAMRRDASGKPVIDRDYLANVERGHSGVSDPMWGTETSPTRWLRPTTRPSAPTATW
jgi:hypothetical protein